MSDTPTIGRIEQLTTAPACGPTHHHACTCREAEHRTEVSRLREALLDCAERFEKARVASGSDAESAAAEAWKYRYLAGQTSAQR